MTCSGPDPEILLGVGGVFRRVPLASIAATTRLPTSTLRDALAGLVFALSDHDATTVPGPGEGEPTEGENGSVGNGSDGTLGGTVSPREQTETVTVPVPHTSPSPTVPSDAPARPNPPVGSALTGAALADLLDDAESRPFYEKLVATTDARLLAHALDETLARRHLLRGRPGGYFTAVIRRLAPPPTPYARTPPTPS